MFSQDFQGWDFGPIAEKPCSQMACSLSQQGRTSSSRSHGDVTSYFISLSVFVGPVLIFLSSSVSSLSGILWPISPRISLEPLWRKAGATSWEKRSAENHQLSINSETSTRPNDPLKMKLARDAFGVDSTHDHRNSKNHKRNGPKRTWRCLDLC